MAVTQYIGSRYVPLFADPIEWSSQNTYEPLTIVLHEGNSFTSKQAVPKGIDISNEDFWAETGNYNAQVELYRRETAEALETAQGAQNDIDVLLPKSEFSEETTVKGYIDSIENEISSEMEAIGDVIPASEFDATNTVKFYIDSEISKISDTEIAKSGVSFVGNYGAKEKDDTFDWQSIIDSIAEVSNTVDFGNGVWFIDESIVIPSNISEVCGSGCVIKATKNLTNMLSLATREIGNPAPFNVRGITFDGDNYASTIVEIGANGNAGHIYDCIFKNFTETAINATSLGMFINGCMFFNTRDRNKGTGIKGITDNFVTDCKFFYCEIGIDFHSGHVRNCYFYTYKPTQETFGITRTDGLIQYLDVSGCEFDGIVHSIGSPQNVVATGNSFIYTEADLTSSIIYSVFHAYRDNIPQVIFDNNFFSVTWSGISTIVRMFTYPNINGTNQVRCYSSKGNVINHLEKASAAVLSQLQLACGFANNEIVGNYNSDGGSSSPNDYLATRLISNESTYNFSNVAIYAEIPFLLCTLSRSSNGQCSLTKITNRNHSASRTHLYFDSSTRTIYITCNPLQISNLKIDGCMLNMPLSPVTTQIDTSGMTVVDAINLAS